MSDTLKALAFDQAKAGRNLNYANLRRPAPFSVTHEMCRPLADAYARTYRRHVPDVDLAKFVNG